MIRDSDRTAAASSTGPFIPTQGIHNLRDFGGYPTQSGGSVKRGVLFRSGQHIGASDSDLDALDALELATIIDLRGNAERKLHPCRRSDSFSADVIFFDGETSSLPPHMDVDDNTTTAEFAHARMIAVYTRMPQNPAMVDLFGRYLRNLATRDGASLVHCFAGKDRTGVAATLLLHILGVSPEDQMREFLLTNDAPTLHILRDQAVPGLQARLNRTLDEGAIRALLEVHADYLNTYLSEAAKLAGSLDDYIIRTLGVDEAVQQALRAKLVT